MSEIPFNVLKSVENTVKPPTPSGGSVRPGRARARAERRRPLQLLGRTSVEREATVCGGAT